MAAPAAALAALILAMAAPAAAPVVVGQEANLAKGGAGTLQAKVDPPAQRVGSAAAAIPAKPPMAAMAAMGAMAAVLTAGALPSSQAGEP